MKMIIVLIIAAAFAGLATLIATAWENEAWKNEPESKPHYKLYKHVDEENGVVCYYRYRADRLSCVKVK